MNQEKITIETLSEKQEVQKVKETVPKSQEDNVEDEKKLHEQLNQQFEELMVEQEKLVVEIKELIQKGFTETVIKKHLSALEKITESIKSMVLIFSAITIGIAPLKDSPATQKFVESLINIGEVIQSIAERRGKKNGVEDVAEIPPRGSDK